MAAGTTVDPDGCGEVCAEGDGCGPATVLEVDGPASEDETWPWEAAAAAAAALLSLSARLNSC